MPMYPNIGNNIFTKFENPKFDIITPVIHIIATICGKLFLSFVIFFKKLIPIDIAVEKIESKITIPYILEN